MSDSNPSRYVSRAGLKLEHALREFKLNVQGFACADFGCNVGGFTDCLLQHGAARVYSIDTGYGTFAYKLRTDPRVIVMERTNALHALPALSDGCDLVTIDLAWTQQRHAIPAALRWLRSDGRIVSLIKPHYELEEDEKRTLLVDGALDPAEAQRVLHRVLSAMQEWGAHPLAHALSPITGSKSSKGKHGSGNVEYLALLRKA